MATIYRSKSKFAENAVANSVHDKRKDNVFVESNKKMKESIQKEFSLLKLTNWDQVMCQSTESENS